MRPSLLLPLFALFVAACTAPQTSPSEQVAPLASCEPAEIQWASAPGTASVDGQAFLKTRGGDVKYGAGNEVQLVPVCAGSTAWVASQTKSKYAHPLDTSLSSVARTTTSSGDGKFHFEQLPAGDYYVVTSVIWEAPTRYGLEKQGGYLSQRVHADSGKTASVIITDQ